MRKKALWTMLPKYKKTLVKNNTKPYRIRRRTKSKSIEDQIYKERAPQFLARPENSICPVAAAGFPFKDGKPRKKKTQCVHHIRGRLGTLYLDERFWLGVSNVGHEWIHQNIAEARKHGWYAQLGEWNNPR